jgi:hypothetical protein
MHFTGFILLHYHLETRIITEGTIYRDKAIGETEGAAIDILMTCNLHIVKKSTMVQETYLVDHDYHYVVRPSIL